MVSHHPTLTSLTVAAALVVFAAAPAVRAQAPSQGDSTWHAARTSDGQPDVQGFWTGAPVAGSAAYDIENGTPPEEHVITGGKAPTPPHVVVDPPVPYRPWARAVRDENVRNAYNPTKLEHIDALSRCFEMGVPRQSFFGGFKILQSTGVLVMIFSNSGYTNTRTIALDGRPHIGRSIKLWMGDSIGRWEGNTLVVDVMNINEHAWYDVGGNFHSSELHLTERWTFTSTNTIEYEVVNDDPKVFTRPWKMKTEFVRDKNPDEQWESACYEGERDVAVMLRRNAK